MSSKWTLFVAIGFFASLCPLHKLSISFEANIGYTATQVTRYFLVGIDEDV